MFDKIQWLVSIIFALGALTGCSVDDGLIDGKLCAEDVSPNRRCIAGYAPVWDKDGQCYCRKKQARVDLGAADAVQADLGRDRGSGDLQQGDSSAADQGALDGAPGAEAGTEAGLEAGADSGGD